MTDAGQTFILIDFDIVVVWCDFAHGLRCDEDELLASGIPSAFDLRWILAAIIVTEYLGLTIISIEISRLALSMNTSLRRVSRCRLSTVELLTTRRGI